MKPCIAALAVGWSLACAAPICAALEPQADAQSSPAAQSSPEDSALRKQLSQLNWIRGPREVPLFGNATLQIPAGYIFLNPEETAKFETITHNVGGGTEYFLAPQDLHWGAHFSYSGDGYVKDDEKIDADRLLSSIKSNTEEGNKIRRERGWDEMEVTGWQSPPHYDPQTHRLEWAVNGRDIKANVDVVNFNTRILGRGGVMSAVLIADPAELAAATQEFKTTLGGFEYDSGQRYAEYKPGDKIAKYGLAALITGGAAAIAVKTGLWKVILGALAAGWKFIAAAAVALYSGIVRWLKRKTT